MFNAQPLPNKCVAADSLEILVLMQKALAAAEHERYVAEIQKFQSLNPVPNLELLRSYDSFNKPVSRRNSFATSAGSRCLPLTS